MHDEHRLAVEPAYVTRVIIGRGDACVDDGLIALDSINGRDLRLLRTARGEDRRDGAEDSTAFDGRRKRRRVDGCVPELVPRRCVGCADEGVFWILVPSLARRA